MLFRSFAGVAVLFVFRMQRSLIDDTVANTALDLSQFSLHPWSTARLALQLGFVGWHVSALGLALLAIRLARLPWRLTGDEVGARLTMVLAWVAPWTLQLARSADALEIPTVAPLLFAAALALMMPRLLARYRRGSQAFRLLVMILALLVPVLAIYATPMTFDDQVKKYQPATPEEKETMQARYDSDMTIHNRHRDDLKKGVPGAKVIDIAGANFYVFASHGDQVASEIKAFAGK